MYLCLPQIHPSQSIYEDYTSHSCLGGHIKYDTIWERGMLSIPGWFLKYITSLFLRLIRCTGMVGGHLKLMLRWLLSSAEATQGGTWARGAVQQRARTGLHLPKPNGFGSTAKRKAFSSYSNQLYTLCNLICCSRAFLGFPLPVAEKSRMAAEDNHGGRLPRNATRCYQYTAAKCSSVCLQGKSLKCKARNLCDRPRKLP